MLINLPERKSIAQRVEFIIQGHQCPSLAVANRLATRSHSTSSASGHIRMSPKKSVFPVSLLLRYALSPNIYHQCFSSGIYTFLVENILSPPASLNAQRTWRKIFYLYQDRS